MNDEARARSIRRRAIVSSRVRDSVVWSLVVVLAVVVVAACRRRWCRR